MKSVSEIQWIFRLRCDRCNTAVT